MTILPERSEIPVEYTWNAESVFVTPVDWENALGEVKEALPLISEYKGKISSSPEQLLGWFNLIEKISRLVGKLFVYAGMDYAVDTTNQEANGRSNRGRMIFAQVAAASAFAEPELMTLQKDTLEKWMEQVPELKVFSHYFDRLHDRKEHIRSAEVEELLGGLMDPFRSASTTHSIIADTDLVFKPAANADGSESFEVAQGTIGVLRSHADRAVRKSAEENYADGFLALKNTLANCLSTGIKQDVYLARARRYPNSLEASLAPNRIPRQVFENLIAVFRKNLPIWHRYWEIRRKALGYDQFHTYDIKAPLAAHAAKIPFSDAVEIIIAGMKPLGSEYLRILERGLKEQRWVDVYPSKGKRSGAFSSGSQGTYPFIMMSYTDDIYSLSTLAHELGHSLHSYLTWQNQSFVYSRYSLFVAEVASNFNQALVRDYLLKEYPDRDFKIGVLEEAMSNFHRYFFIMPTLARFELEIHERVERGEALSAQNLIELMADLFGEGYGEGVVQDRERNGITWAQFSNHMYANFYVYQYATGISGAHALASRIVRGEPGSVEQYLGFLKAGGSMYPLDALRMAGVDLSKPEPVESAFATLSGYVDMLEELLA